MDTTNIKKLAALFFLWGCQSSPTWYVSHQGGAEKQFESARLAYPVRDKVNEVAVEMVYAKESTRTYLSVLTQRILPFQGNPKEARVTLKIAEQTIEGIAHRHQGGQRAMLPQELQEVLIQHLLEGTPVTIQLEGYSTTLDPDQFALSYQELQKMPLNIPVQLPFKL